MLTRRIIPCLDVKDNRVVKGVNFLNLRDAGDPVELGARYSDEGADELVFLDITATIRSRNAKCGGTHFTRSVSPLCGTVAGPDVTAGCEWERALATMVLFSDSMPARHSPGPKP